MLSCCSWVRDGSWKVQQGGPSCRSHNFYWEQKEISLDDIIFVVLKHVRLKDYITFSIEDF